MECRIKNNRLMFCRSSLRDTAKVGEECVEATQIGNCTKSRNMNKNFWMSMDPGSLGDGEVAYDNSSRIEPKRSHQWFMDGTEAELFPNKRQAVEVPIPSYSGPLSSNLSAWGNASSIQSAAGQFTERLFDHGAERTINFNDRNLPSVGMSNINMGGKVVEDPFGIDPSFGLSISHRLEDPRLSVNYGGIRKVKVNEVKDSESFITLPMGNSYSSGDNSIMSTPHVYSKANDNSITVGLSFNRGNDNMILMGETFNREDSNFITMGQPYNKGDNSEMSMGLTCRENTGSIPIGHSVRQDSTDNTAIAQAFIKGDENSVQMSSFNENNCSISVGRVFSEDNSDITSFGNTFNKGFCNAISTCNKIDDNTLSMSKIDSSDLSIGHSFSKVESNIISFGGLNDDDDHSGRLICSYDLLMGQNSVQRSEALTQKGLVESNTDALGIAQQIIVSGETVSKKKGEQKASKKATPNNFPSNVRSLLSTGMLDGVPVKYVAWSREKELRGIIKGSAYLCGCQSCSYSKAINAFEFERHAGCKTKHPNNHIYFENGKTIYGIVQELRNTPQNLLFDVIQTITGSQINQKSFRLWKESFLAATRELQRIYGKEDVKIIS